MSFLGSIRSSILIVVFMSAAFSFAQKEDWLPITPQDLQYKDVPGQSGASAVRLYYAQYLDDNASSEFVYERIKILNEKALNPNSEGKTYADVEIPILNISGFASVISDLKARTIRPDGSIVEFTGKPFEKTLYKGRGNKVAVKAFSMPEVTVGAIVEYKYKRRFQIPLYLAAQAFTEDEWRIQRELFTVKENLYFKPFEGGGFQSASRPQYYWQGAQISRVTFNLKEKPKSRGNEAELELQNVPAFEAEDYMPPESNYKPSVIFFYVRKGFGSVEKEWEDINKTLVQGAEEFLARNGGVREAALQAVGNETEPSMKLLKLYERAQQIRNLTYERQRMTEERKKENLLRSHGAGDVLAHGYGSSEEITQLFIALARAAGFDASVVQVSDREKRFFAKDWTSLQQLDSMIAVVNVNGSDLYLEPGTRFCPYGFLRWNHTATDALKVNKKDGAFVKTPPLTYEKSLTKKSANVALSESGDLKGEVTIEFKGIEALEHRLDAIDSDSAGKKKDLEDELKQWLPAGTIVKMTTSDGWEGANDPLVAHFTIEVPSYASVTGKLLLIPVCLFQSKQHKTFMHAERKYPVYFAYPFTELDEVSITVPAGFTLESVPAQQDASLKVAKYQAVSQFDGSRLVTQRKLAFNGIYFDLDKYPELKSFFSKVRTGDEQQAVLQGGGARAQKGN